MRCALRPGEAWTSTRCSSAPVDEGADVLFVAPTNTYLAYANDHFAASDMSAIMGHERVDLGRRDLHQRAPRIWPVLL